MRRGVMFNPEPTQTFGEPWDRAYGDADRGSVYVYDEQIVLTIDIALVTNRPILVRGQSGCGKSTLARNVAYVLGWPYYEHVVTSRTQARDLLWRVDLLRRFHDAQVGGGLRDIAAYIEPGILWWAFAGGKIKPRDESPTPIDPAFRGSGDGQRAVVLIDEVDKADPDVPNDLLVPLDSLRFRVEETGETVCALEPPLVFITSNEERELPLAFQRRCIELRLAPPDREGLIAIGRAHFPDMDEKLLREVAGAVAATASYAETYLVPQPSTAEYLDTVLACHRLAIKPGSESFEALAAATAWKPGSEPEQL